MKIAVYVLNKNAKQTYKKECFNVRLNAGISIVMDILRRQGYVVDFCSSANVHNYDVVLFAVTSDCDWWTFIAERVKWQKGNYKVVVGGAGVLNVRPFLPYVDYFVLYTWQRKPVLEGAFAYSGLWNGGKDRERAILDLYNGEPVDLNKLRTTAIDGLSERLRFMVNKKITNEMLVDFIQKLALCEKPHRVKFYNIIGYPTETEADYQDF